MWPGHVSNTRYTVVRARNLPSCSIVSLQWLLDSEKAGTLVAEALGELRIASPEVFEKMQVRVASSVDWDIGSCTRY
jgi:hypothetical protein